MPIRAYFDHNAAAPLSAAARRAIAVAIEVTGNPSSVHADGRAARRIIEDARAEIAGATGAQAADVVFAGSGTEACQLMLRHTGRTRLLAAATEHVAVLASPHETLPVQKNGLLDLDAFDNALGSDGADAVVAVMLANNETGVIQPIAEIAEIAHARGALLAVDAAQALGKIKIDIGELGADALALSSAKVGGPLGVGAAVFRTGVTPTALIAGGGQERGLRGGSENVIGVAGFGAAAADVPDLLKRQPEIARLRDRLEAAIVSVAPIASAAGGDAPRLASTSALPMPGTPASTQVMALDLAGFSVSAGAACSSGKVGRSHVLDAMGLPDDIVESTIRVSLGPDATDAQIDGFTEAWRALYSARNARNPAEAAEA